MSVTWRSVGSFQQGAWEKDMEDMSSLTDITSANQLPRPGDHTVNDSARFLSRDIILKPAHHILTQD